MAKTLPLDPNESPIVWLSHLSEAEVRKVLGRKTEAELLELQHTWRGFYARPNQLAPGPNVCRRMGCQHDPGQWFVWLCLAGRGWGKTRVGSEWINEQARLGKRRWCVVVGRTVADVRDVMVEGPDGILTRAHPKFRPIYEPTKRKLTWPNGVIAHTYSAEEPSLLRGPQHDLGWVDELASFQFTESWDNLILGLRAGTDPRCLVTTTPKPRPLIKALVADPSTHVTRGRTFR